VAFIFICLGSVALFVILLVALCCCCPCCWLAQKNERKRLRYETERLRAQQSVQGHVTMYPTAAMGAPHSAPVSRAASPPPPGTYVVHETHLYPNIQPIGNNAQQTTPPPYEFVSDRQSPSFSSRMSKAKDKTVEVAVLAKDKTSGAVKSLGNSFSRSKSDADRKEPIY